MSELLELESNTYITLKVNNPSTEIEITSSSVPNIVTIDSITEWEINPDTVVDIEVITDNGQLIVPGTNRVTYLAGGTIFGGRAVELNNQGRIIHANSSGSGFGIIGVAVQSGIEGNNIEVVTYGAFTDNSLNLQHDEPIFLRDNGLLSQTPPSNGVTVVIGSAISTNTMFIRIEQPIYMIIED